MVRAKFTVLSKTTNDYTNGKTMKVELMAVNASSEENKKFFASTPSGKIELSLVNQDVFDSFLPGKECYVDFTLAE